MVSQPLARGDAGVAGQVVGDHHDLASRVGLLDQPKKALIVGAVTGRRGAGDGLAVGHPQPAVHPGLLRPAAVLQWRLDPVASSRPARCRWERPRDHRAELVSADHRHPGRRVGREVDDAGPWGRTLGHYWPSKSAGAASVPLLQQDATDLTALDGDPQLVSGLDQRIQRPPTGPLGVDRSQGAVGLPDQPAGRSWPTKATSWPRSVWSSRRGRPDRGRSPSPSTPWVLQRCSHCRTVLG
jgi:hypothetical protein